MLSASEHVGDAPYGVGNADDIYGRAACALLAEHLAPAAADTNALVGYRLADAVIGSLAGHPGHLPRRRRRHAPRGGRAPPGDPATPEGGFVAGDGREPAVAVARRPGLHEPLGVHPGLPQDVLQAAMDAATDASEEAEVLLPEVVAAVARLQRPSPCCRRQGRCIGVTHPDDLSLVQAELNRQVAAGERPARLWASLR